MRQFLIFFMAAILLIATGCSNMNTSDKDACLNVTIPSDAGEPAASIAVSETDREFHMDNVLSTDDLGKIHYNLSIPHDYDGAHSYALHIALPGWEGLYFQGVGEDLRWEYLPHESVSYVDDMIVASVQLGDWGETSAKQAVMLTEHLLDTYSIDRNRVYITGYSAGGETLSRVLEIKPELYRAALFVSSKWDGDPTPLTEAHTVLYLFTSEHDSYYGAEPAREAWQRIHDLYLSQGLREGEIAALLVLEVREDAWFDEMMAEHAERTGSQDATDYHGAGMLVAFDESVMRWVFR